MIHPTAAAMRTDNCDTTMVKRSQASTLPPPLREWIITKHNQSSAPSSPPRQRTMTRHNQLSAPSTAAVMQIDDRDTTMAKRSQASTLPPPLRKWIMTNTISHPPCRHRLASRQSALSHFRQAAASTTKLAAATVLSPPPPLPPRSHDCTSTAYKIKNI